MEFYIFRKDAEKNISVAIIIPFDLKNDTLRNGMELRFLLCVLCNKKRGEPAKDAKNKRHFIGMEP